MLNNDFLRLFPGTEGLEFDYDNPRPQNAEAINAERAPKTTAFSTLVLAGVAPDDAANVVGLPPMAMNPIPTQPARSEEHTSELQSLMRISYAVFCLKNKRKHTYTYKDRER